MDNGMKKDLPPLNHINPSPLDRFLLWWLPALAALTPLVVIYTLLRPHEGQSFFFQASVWLATALLGCGWLLGRHALPGLRRPVLLLFAVNALAFFLSLIHTSSPLFSLRQGLLPCAGFLFFGLIVISPRRRMMLGRVSAALIGVGLLLALYGIAQYFGFEFLKYGGQVEKNRVIATIGHPNYLASVLGPLVFLILALLPGRPDRRFLIGGLSAIGLLLFCILLARTRAVWLGIFIGLAVAALLGLRCALRQRLRLRRFALGVLVALLLPMAAAFILLPLAGQSINLRERLTSSNEIKSRFFYWNAAIDQGLRHPVTGLGYAMFDPHFWPYAIGHQKSSIAPYYYDFLPAISGRNPGHVHNEYLEVFCEQGMLGLASLLAVLGFFAWFGGHAILRQSGSAETFRLCALYGGFVMILVDAAFSFPWRLPVSLIVFMVILAWLYDSIYPQEA